MLDIYIINEDGAEEVFKSVQPTDESYHLRELQGKDECEIKLELPEYVDFPLGCYMTWKGNKYTLCAPAQIEKNGVRKLSYTLTFSGSLKSLAKYRMRHIVSSVLQDSKLDFSITAYPHEILQMIVDNINYRESGWSVGKCEPTSMVTQTYSQTTVEQALANLAEECDTEYEIDGKTIHLRKVEYNKSNPIALQYGKGGGFIPGVARKNASDTNPMEILFVQGGEQNIDSSKYGCTTLLMPSNSGMVVYYDGENYRFVNSDGTATADDGFNADNARAYKVSTDRMSIERADVAKSSYTEGAMTDTDIYPKRVGTVTAVINEDGNAKKVLFQDSSIPETLNYKELTAAGSSLNVVFNSGMLTGKTFEVNYNHAKRQFAMIGTTIDDVAMPDETWRPAVGDEFVILNMVMPTDYLYNHTLHTGAEYDLLRAAVKYMYENEDDKYTFEGTLDTIWSKANWTNIGGMIKPGGYVKFIDPQFEAAGVSLRITSVKESINNPYAPTIEISNSQNASSVSNKIANIEATTPVAIETARRAAENFANRGFAAVKETTDMLSEQFEGYTESITPVSVQTMQTIVGDESLQYAFYATESGTDEIAPAVNYDSAAKTVIISYYDTDTTPYYLRHKTLGVTTMSTADYNGNTLKQWALYSFTSGDLDESKSYYIYVKAPTDTTEAATFLLSDTAKQMEDETGYYLLLFGFLNKPDTSGARSFAQMYGYSEILPGRITTDKVVSQDGKTGFDLVNGRIYGNIEFSASEDNTAVINNIINANTKVVSTEATANKAYSSSLSSSFYTRNFLRNSKPKSLSNFYQFPLTGRNFLRNTDLLNSKGDFRGCSSFVDSSNTSSSVSTNTYGFYCGYGGGIKFDISDPEQCSPIMPIDSYAYTFSISMRQRTTSATATITATFADGSSEVTTCEPTTTAARFSATWWQLPLTIKVAAVGGYVAFMRAQLETGIVAREWAAAPEDASGENAEYRNLILRGEASVELDYSSTTAYTELSLSPTAMNRPLKDEYMYLSYEQRGWSKSYYPVNRGIQFCDDKVETLTLVSRTTGTLSDFTRFVFRFKASSKYTAKYLRLCCTSSGISHTGAVTICNVMLAYGNATPTAFLTAPEDNDRQLEDNGVNVNTRSNLYTYPMNNQRAGYYTVAAYAGDSTHMAGYKVTHVSGQDLPNFMSYDNTTPTLSAKLTGICKVSIDIEVSTTALWNGMAIEISPVEVADLSNTYAYGRLHLKHYKQTSTTRRTYYGYWNLKDGYDCYNTTRLGGLFVYYGSSFTDTSAWWFTVNNLELCQCKETPSAYLPTTWTWDCTTGGQDASALKANEFNTAAAYKRRSTEIYTFTGFTAGHNYEVTAASTDTDRVTLPAGSYCYSYIVEAANRPKVNGWRTYQTTSGQLGTAIGKVIPYGVASDGTPRWLCFVTFTLSQEYADLRIPNIYFTPGQSDNIIYCARLESGTTPSLANYGLTDFSGTLADNCITMTESEEPTIDLKDGGRVMLYTKDTDSVVSELFPTGLSAYALSLYVARYDARASSEDGATKIGEVVVDYADKTSETMEITTEEAAGNFTRPVFILSQTPVGITFAGDTSHTLIFKKLKLEVGTAATVWLESPEDTDSQYLRDALQEATDGTSTISGGLVLSKYIGVKDTAGVTVAGMSGTSQASAGSLPMIWAGAAANTDTGMNSAKFRVFKSGHVDMSDVSISAGTSGAQGMTIENGNITLGTMGDDGEMASVKTQILSQTFATNAAALSSRKASTSSKASTGYGFSPLSGTPVVSVTIVTHAKTEPSGTGTITITGANLIATLTGYASSAWRRGLTMITDSLTDDISPEGTSNKKTQWVSAAVGSLTAKVALYVTVNGKSMATVATATKTESDTEQTVYTASTNTAYQGKHRQVSKTVTANASFSTTKTQTVSFNPGDAIGLKCEVSLTSSGNWGTLTKTCTTTAQCSYSSVGEAYNNVYYSNGLLLSSASNKYFAVNSSDTTTNGIIKAQHTNAIFKFTANGLLQSFTGDAPFYRVSPLVAIIKLSYNAATTSGYNVTMLYRIKSGSSTPYATRAATGNVLLTHYLSTNMGVSSYAAQGTYYCTGSTEYSRTLMFDNIASDTMRVHFMIGNSHYDPQNTGYLDYAMIFFFDYGQYN